MTLDLSTWPTKKQTCDRLEVSPRTLHRLVKARKIELRRRKVPGRCPEPVYNPRDVEAIAALNPLVRIQGEPPPELATPQSPPLPPPLHLALLQTALLFERVVGPMVDQNQQLLQELRAVLCTVHRLLPTGGAQTRDVRTKLWLSITEASEYSGLTCGAVRRFVRLGYIASVLDREGTKVSRASLDEFAARPPARTKRPVRPVSQAASAAGGDPV